jgi:RNA polymerase sigma-70 factor, ECF subfamily
MNEDFLAERFQAHRAHLHTVAYRMLGSGSDADDAVQEAWLRLGRADIGDVENLAGWLTTVVARVCLNVLQARRSRREEPLQVREPGPGAGPDHEAVLADSVGLALLMVLDTLTPAERLAFVLHDMFAVPFEEIAPIVDRTPTAARQLASRARRRVQGTAPATDADPARQRQVVAAFLAASRGGDFDALLALLDPDVVLRADRTVVRMGGVAAEVRGAANVAETFSGRARATQLAIVNGAPGLAWAVGGQPRVVFAFTIMDGDIVAIEMIADPERLGRMDLAILE